ncbi:MAG: alpha/beta hydrolase [Chloroflexota bacterium]
MTTPKTTQAQLHDGSSIDIEIYGEGQTILLPVNPHPIEGEQAEQMRMYGADPALGQALIQGLSDTFRVVAFDYEGQAFNLPKALTLTPDNVAQDMLALADSAGAERFAYYGYSWLALVGMQLAVRTNRLSALIMGGFPPVNGPYAEMLKVTTAAFEMSGGNQTPETANDEWSTAHLSKGQTQQFVTLYEALQSCDDQVAQAHMSCPRLCFVGSADRIEYAPHWGGVTVDLAAPIIAQRSTLAALGWDVRVLDGLDHMGAMQAAQVIPIIRPWLISKLVSPRPA